MKAAKKAGPVVEARKLVPRNVRLNITEAPQFCVAAKRVEAAAMRVETTTRKIAAVAATDESQCYNALSTPSGAVVKGYVKVLHHSSGAPTASGSDARGEAEKAVLQIPVFLAFVTYQRCSGRRERQLCIVEKNERPKKWVWKQQSHSAPSSPHPRPLLFVDLATCTTKPTALLRHLPSGVILTPSPLYCSPASHKDSTVKEGNAAPAKQPQNLQRRRIVMLPDPLKHDLFELIACTVKQKAE